MKKLRYTIALICLCLMLSSWGSKGHKKISQNTAAALPAQLSFLIPSWTNFIASHASDADYRKNDDPDESPRHYIDIDNYPEFVQNGSISQDYDSVVAKYGYNFVIDQGILPWTTLRVFDSLKSCFQRGDWNRSALYAADLGHYVGDGHMPLHITRNYNGQMTGQSGIHSRYETSMVTKYESQLTYTADSAQFINDVSGFVFDYLYRDYTFVDSILAADDHARLTTGSTSSDAYYQALWSRSGNFTITLMRNGSNALASLIYTAWVQAGSPMFYPNAIDDMTMNPRARILQNYPNPVKNSTIIPVEIVKNGKVTISILDATGRVKEILLEQTLEPGNHEIPLNAANYPDGMYVILLRTGDEDTISKTFTVKN